MNSYDAIRDDIMGGRSLEWYVENILQCTKRRERKLRMHQWRLLSRIIQGLEKSNRIVVEQAIDNF